MAVGDAVKTMRSRFVIPRQSIYEESAAAKHAFGDMCCLPGSRLFVYCKNGAVALTDGIIVQAAAPLANHKNRALNAAAAIGALKVQVAFGATAAAANYYSEGYLHFNDVAPEGTIYKVKSHLAISGSDNVWINFYDPLWKAATTSSEVTLTKAKEDSVIILPNTGLTAPAVGVPLIDITASYYFWAQCYGPCPVLTQGTVVIGQPVTVGGTTDGAVGPCTAVTDARFGDVMQVNASTEYSLIFLKISA